MIQKEFLAGRKVIGTATYGTMYDFDRQVVKIVKKNPKMMKEVEILRELNHQNIVKMRSYKEYEDGLLIYMEKCNGSLQELLKEKSYFKEEEALEVIHQIGMALDYLNTKKVRHMDIKLQNILYKKDYGEIVYKLSNFGVSLRNIEPSAFHYCKYPGTPSYVAPQLHQDKAFSSSSDIWSLGIVFYHLLFQKTPFSIDSLRTNQRNALEDKQFRQNLSKLKFNASKQLLQGMLQFSDLKRMPINQLLKTIVNFKSSRKLTMAPIQRPLQKVLSNQNLNNYTPLNNKEPRPVSSNKAPVPNKLSDKKEQVRPNYSIVKIAEKDLMSLLEIQLKSNYLSISIDEFSLQTGEQMPNKQNKQFSKILRGLKQKAVEQLRKSVGGLKK